MDARKPDLRRKALARRDLVSPQEAHDAAAIVAKRGVALAQEQLAGRLSASCVASYWPIRSEIGTRPLIEALSALGVATALPVMHGAGRPLEFRLWRPGDELEHGPLGLSQPAAAAKTVVPDLIFAPLAAFDAQGHRIGYGGGNYDATLAALRRHGRGVIAAGLAYAVQEIGRVPAEPHDQMLDFVITEEKVFMCGSGLKDADSLRR